MSDAFGTSFHIGQLVRILRRRWRVVAACALLAGTAALAIGVLLPPRYTAKAQIVLEPPPGDRAVRLDDMTVQTWAELMSTTEHLRRLQESLERDPPEIASVEYERPVLTMFAESVMSAIARLRDTTPEDAPAGAATPAADDLPSPRELDRRLKAFKERQSRILAVTFTWTDPAMAAAIANRSATLFLEDQLRQQEEERQQTLQALQRRSAQAREDISRAALALSDYRVNHGTANPDRDDQIDAQIAEIARQLVIATADLASARQTDPQGGAAAMPAPRPAGVSADTVARAALRSDVGTPVATADSAVLEARIHYLSTRLAALQEASAAARTEEARLRDLRLEASAANSAYEAVLAQQLSLSASPVRPQASMVSVAVPPLQPSSPDPVFFVAPALVAGSIGGGLLAVLLQRLDRRARTERQVEATLGVPCISVVPKASGMATLLPVRALLRKPFAPYTKAIRATAMARLGLPGEQTPGKVILFTSSERAEGKTALAVSFAAYAALLRRRVLIVDLDLTSPSLAALLGAPSGPDALDVLRGVSLSDAVRSDDTFGFDYLPLASDKINPLLLMASERMRALLDEARRRYDCIVLDGAALLGNPEVRVLVALADHVILTLKWGSTRLDTARVAMEDLVRARPGEATQAAVSAVLTQVEPRLYPMHATWPEEDRPAHRLPPGGDQAAQGWQAAAWQPGRAP